MHHPKSVYLFKNNLYIELISIKSQYFIMITFLTSSKIMLNESHIDS